MGFSRQEYWSWVPSPSPGSRYRKMKKTWSCPYGWLSSKSTENSRQRDFLDFTQESQLQGRHCLFMYLLALCLRCCPQAFPGFGEWGVLAFIHCDAQPSHRSGFSCCRARALDPQASVIAAQGLSSCDSWA